MSKDLSYHKHVKNITSAAAKRFYIAKSCFRSTSIPVLRLILKAFIIPSLEYGSVIWNLHSRHEIYSLEKVQRRITALALFDRTRKGGGVAIYCKQELRTVMIIYIACKFEIIAIKVYTVCGKAFTICCAYRSPSSTAE